MINSATKQLMLSGGLTIYGNDSGTITVGGDIYDSITINGGLIGSIGTSTTTTAGVSTVTANTTGGQIITQHNLIGALTINGAMSGLVAVGGDIGAIELTNGYASNNGSGNASVTSTNSLVRFGGFTVNGVIGGDVVVLGNVFSDFSANGGISGRVAVQGKDEYGLNQTLSSTDNYTTADARVGMLGKVTVIGALSGALVSGGVIGDDGMEYNPLTAQSNDATGTLATVSQLTGVLAAAEDINGGSNVANATGFFQDLSYQSLTPSAKYNGGQNLAVIDAIFASAGTYPPLGSSGLALILGDLSTLHVVVQNGTDVLVATL